MKIGQQKIEQFLADLASTRPAPGGGSAAALAGAVAASLVEKVANLTLGKKGYEKVEKEVKQLRDEAKKLRGKLLQLADEDAQAFNQVMAAYKLPRGEKGRAAKMEKSLKRASEVPLEVAKLSFAVADRARAVAKKGNKNAYSDARSAFFLAQAAAKSAVENVKINLELVKSGLWKKKITKSLRALY